ncbi:histidine kinase [Actinomyces sp. B33]|uniref:sensor histidine kinase n=1 Tax=Actinomyces sp. B33 TaxID=2942131 RepID=UPI00233FDAAC|nr:histidine kinase [Actinomyces sp. B33]MDC4232695.1 histidine kinase [Actinomyces sp. B33]
MPLPRLPRLRTADLVTAGLLGVVTAMNPHAFTPDGSVLAAAIGPDAVVPFFWGFTLVCCAAIAVRTRLPLVCVVVVEAALAAHLVVFESLSLLAVGVCLVAAETIGSRIGRPWSWALLAVMAVGSAATVLRVSPLFSDEVALWTRLFLVLAAAWSLIGAAYLWGLNRRRSRDRVEQAVARAEEIAAHAEDRRRLAVAEERQRIARDVHDVLGHSLAVIGMQAEGARAVLAADPARADGALATIGELSRVGVDDVRRLVDVLREDSPVPSATAGVDSAPAHRDGQTGSGAHPPARAGAAGLVALVDRVRSAGVDVRLRVDAEAAVPAAVDAAASGICHEALTNAVRHGAGPVLVDLRVDADGLDLTVSSAPGPRSDDDASPGRVGAGLRTMRERAEAVGGECRSAPGPDGRWLVRAHLPARRPGAEGAGR